MRKAIAMTIDAQALVDTVMLGQGTVLPLSYYHPDLPYAVNIPHKLDPEGAQKLLDEAGLKDTDGDGIREFNGQPMEYEVLCDVNNAVEVRSTEMIAGWLKDIGISVRQKALDIDTAVSFIWPSFVAVSDPDYDLAIWGWSNGPQIQRGFLNFLTNRQFGTVGWANLTGMGNAELDQLFAEFTTNPDPVRREELNRLTQERFAEILPFIPLMSPGGNFAYRPQAYDGWVYVKGTGIMTVWSFLPSGAAKVYLFMQSFRASENVAREPALRYYWTQREALGEVSTPFAQYYSVRRFAAFPTPLWVALYAHLFSASRGLLVYSPFLIITLVGCIWHVRRLWRNGLFWLCCG